MSKCPNQRAWQRFRRNRVAMFGLAWVCCLVLVAIFGYLPLPDTSPDANRQMPSVALQPMGFRVKVLEVVQNITTSPTSWWQKWLNGAEDVSDFIPVSTCQIIGDSVVVQKYTGTEVTKRLAFHIIDVAYAVASPNPDIIRKGDSYSFKNAEGNTQVVTVKSVQQLVNQRNITDKTAWLGTDNFGRDVLSRLLLGVRISLAVGLVAVFISLLIGLLLGAVAGYFGGRTDDAVMLLLNTLWSIPTLLFVFAIVLALGRGVWIIFVAIGLTMWVDVARLVRGQTLSLREAQYIEAARGLGFRSSRILLWHILPNLLGPVIVLAASNFATAILIESGLSYLGFGVQPPTPSWGTMLNENYGYAIGGKPILMLAPALAIVLTVLAFNLVGNGVRDAYAIND